MQSKASESAMAYVVDPLTSTSPSEETGLNSSFRDKDPDSESFIASKRSSSKRTSKNPFIDTSDKEIQPSSYMPTPPRSASPTQGFTRIGAPSIATGTSRGSPPPYTDPRVSSEVPTSTIRHSSRRSSMYESTAANGPLAQIRRDHKAANRAPHLRKHAHVGSDTIDRLDATGGYHYHHDGPFDAVLLAKNQNSKASPVAATRGTNVEALRATPRERVVDSLHKHMPLTGVADVPPGMADREGRVLRYHEGPNLLTESGYKRWPDERYHPDDIKGKGEPTFSLERAEKAKASSHRRVVSNMETSSLLGQRKGDIELQSHSDSRPMSSKGPSARVVSTPIPSSSTSNSKIDDRQRDSLHFSGGGSNISYADWNSSSDLGRRNTIGGLKNRASVKLGEGLGLRRKKDSVGAAS